LFDVAFSEIFVIVLVALVVIGPEKLPKVARTLGLLTGKVQRYVASVKADIDRELRLEEVQHLEKEASNSILSAQTDVSNELNSTESQIIDVLGAAKKNDSI